MFLGCLWVYQIFPINPDFNRSCDPLAYYTAFTVLTITLFCATWFAVMFFFFFLSNNKT